MLGEDRREEIIKIISNSERPIAAKKLAEQFHISRQVVVQDIALIRAAGYDIIATNRGYLIQKPASCRRTFQVSHSEKQMEDELNTIVDCGGKVENVTVKHEIYGEVTAPLNLSSRRNIQEFLKEMKEGKSSPLMKITENVHYHTVEADCEEALDFIEEALRKKGYLVC